MNYEELVELADEARADVEGYDHTIRVCTAAGCLSSGSGAVKDALETEVGKRGEGEHRCRVSGAGCMGLCAGGPLVKVDDDVVYRDVTAEHAAPIVDSLGGDPLSDLRIDPDDPFFARQMPIVLENCGTVDPERLEDYLARDGYQALWSAVHERTPAEVLDEINHSGLRGRGGAGYPTGLKWTTVAKAKGREKCVVCNADEGDPGAFMDRSVLEGDPHRVLEGMALAGYAVGASQGYIYVRVEYPLAVERLQKAIKLARRANFLGHRVCGTEFAFHVEIRLGAGAFVCGEETALMASIEGRRGNPRPRPPYPAQAGLWGRPTLVNNVESFANVPAILRRGSDWFSQIGTAKSKGTKVFALAGRVRNTGLIEVPMGTTLRDIIFDIGGGIPDGREFKAVQTGGPSGGCIPADHLDTPVDYESLQALGSIMGSGGMIVMDDSSSMVEVARYFMEFSKTESCGKCVPCRVGTVQVHDLLQRILDGTAPPDARQQLHRYAHLLREASLCGLGQSASNPVLSTLQFFGHEYDELLGATEEAR
ncbi:MAG TPA: NuoF family protein [Candidatus Krumholzibacteria bacterium]|nr:NuoF family protein [Candidatus Krumholzibacteria bacterium]